MMNSQYFQYNFEQNFPVKLNMFSLSEIDFNRVILLKFINNIDARLKDIVFEIKFKNQQGEVVDTVKYSFENAYVDGFEEFTPKRKIIIPDYCADIEFNLLKAVYLNFTWENGVMVKNNEVLKHSNSFSLIEIKPFRSFWYHFLFVGFMIGFMIYYYMSFEGIDFFNM